MCQLAACRFSCHRAALAISPRAHGQGFRSSKLSRNTKYTVKSSLVSLLSSIQTLQSSINSHFTFTVNCRLVTISIDWSVTAALSLGGAGAGASNGKISIFFTISSSAMFYGSEAGRRGGGGRSANLLIIGFSRLFVKLLPKCNCSFEAEILRIESYPSKWQYKVNIHVGSINEQ